MNIILTIVSIGLFLGINELWWRQKKHTSETSRRVVHITLGTFIAFWPFYLSWDEIRVLGLAFLLVIVVSKRYSIFKSIHNVKRSTMGELFFALSIALVTFITQNKYIYLAALLQMSLADGAAAILGSRYFAKHRIMLLNNRKSLAGSLAFFIVSSIILLFYSLLAPGAHWSLGLVLLAAVLTVIEYVSPYGSDDLSVPLITALLLRL